MCCPASIKRYLTADCNTQRSVQEQYQALGDYLKKRNRYSNGTLKSHASDFEPAGRQ